MGKQNIVLDCDGILADCLGYITQHLGTKYNTDFSAESWQEQDFREWPQYKKEDEEYFQSSGLCLNFKPYPGAANFVEELHRRDLEVIYCTSPYRGSPTWTYDRTKWLAREFGADRKSIIFASTGMKKFVSGYTLIDDHPVNCTTWSEHNKQPAILFNRPWNKKFREEENFKHRHFSFQASPVFYPAAINEDIFIPVRQKSKEIHHIVGLEESYGIDCAENYEQILSILDFYKPRVFSKV